MNDQTPLVGIVMGSKSDWDVMKNATDMLTQLDIPFEAHALSAHRNPAQVHEWASSAEARGVKAIMPHVDDFRAVHSLSRLRDIGTALSQAEDSDWQALNVA